MRGTKERWSDGCRTCTHEECCCRHCCDLVYTLLLSLGWLTLEVLSVPRAAGITLRITHFIIRRWYITLCILFMTSHLADPVPVPTSSRTCAATVSRPNRRAGSSFPIGCAGAPRTHCLACDQGRRHSRASNRQSNVRRSDPVRMGPGGGCRGGRSGRRKSKRGES